MELCGGGTGGGAGPRTRPIGVPARVMNAWHVSEIEMTPNVEKGMLPPTNCNKIGLSSMTNGKIPMLRHNATNPECRYVLHT